MKSKIGFVTVILVVAAISGCSVTSIKTAQIHLRIPAPTVALADVPVHAAIKLPEEFANVPVEEIAVVLKEQGKPDTEVPGQIVMDNENPQLWWLLPCEKANVQSTWTATLVHRKKTDTKGFSWKDTPADHLDLLFNGRRVIRYEYARDTSTTQRTFETSKPFHNFFDAAGRNIITNCDPNALYPHHRGLFIGWSKLEFDGKEYDFWGMTKGDTAQLHQKFLEQTAGPVLARTNALIHWDSNDGTIISEQRQVTVFRQTGPAVALLEFKTQLKAVNGDVLLIANKGNDAHKAPEHGGIQYRPHNDAAKASKRSETYTEKLAEQDKVTYLFHENAADPKTDKDIPWVAMSHGLNNTHYTIQHINYPDNPSPTVYSAYRAYGRFGAYFKKKIKAGQTLTLRYYIWAAESKMPTRQELADRYYALVNAPAVEVLTGRQK